VEITYLTAYLPKKQQTKREGGEGGEGARIHKDSLARATNNLHMYMLQ